MITVLRFKDFQVPFTSNSKTFKDLFHFQRLSKPWKNEHFFQGLSRPRGHPERCRLTTSMEMGLSLIEASDQSVTILRKLLRSLLLSS